MGISGNEAQDCFELAAILERNSVRIFEFPFIATRKMLLSG